MATPIGNLGDITLRALETLRAVDVIAAEDTRVTRGLLAHFSITTRLVAIHAHNERSSADKVCEWLESGKSVALVTDAGTPAVSDPGASLVARVREAGHRIVPVPGASALTAALSAGGIAADGVVFAGFLPVKGADRRAKLADLAATPWAIVLFEAPHRIEATLADLLEALGERDIVIARELTKRFETLARMPLSRSLEWVRADDNRRRGEFVLVLDASRRKAARPDGEALLRALLRELPAARAAAVAAKLSGGKKSDLYALALKIKR